MRRERGGLCGILFDKDGTLVDFDRTWGPAAHAVMATLTGGDRGRFEDLMRVSHYVEAERRFLPTLSPQRASALMGQWEHAVRQASLA